MKIFFLLSFVIELMIFTNLSAQQEEFFKPNGTPEIKIFTSFSTSFSNGESFNKFDVTRAYLGYFYNFSKTMMGRVTYDAGNPSSGKFQFAGYLKYAYLQYHKDKLTVKGGMMLTPQYEYCDKKLGFRYISKTPFLEYGFGEAADIGISFMYEFTSLFSADFVIMNGEGNKLMEADSAFKTGIGLTFIPLKNLSLRGYFDNMKKGNISQQSFGFLMSFEIQRFNLSVLYDFQKNHNLIIDQDYSVISLNSSFLLKNNVKLFARFDNNDSKRINNAATPWNISKDGKQYIAGMEFIPVPGIKISPNFQGWQPADRNKPFISRFFLSMEIRI